MPQKDFPDCGIWFQVRNMKTTDSIQNVKGIGAKTASLLQKIGITTVGDFLRHYPRDYRAYEEPLPISDKSKDDQGPAAYSVHLCSRPVPVSRGRNSLTILKLQDKGVNCSAVWFHSPFVTKRLTLGCDYVLYGHMTTKGGRRSLEHPDIFTPEEYEKLRCGLQPVYALTEGLSQNFFHKNMRLILDNLDLSDDPLSSHIRLSYHLAEYNFAMQQIHFPDHTENLKAARNRLVFDEFFLFALQLKLLGRENRAAANAYPVANTDQVDSFIQNLPYTLTDAQLRVLEEIKKDLGGPHAMNRLIQGDVGSGKTIVAALAMLSMAFAGHQAALMAPTEVLAVQHFEKLQPLFAPYHIRTVLLTGSMTAAQKRKVYAQMEAKEADIVIGTQALFQDKAVYADLGLIVTDEQHRFGVAQRQRLADKSLEKTPHILVMSATPIPRTLAIILYSDLDLSALDEKPQNRLPIKTAVVGTEYRPKAYRFIENQVRMGYQVYIICPMVEKSDQIDAENVIDYTETMKKILTVR